MDNLSRTRDDLKSMSIDYLQALKQELEDIGTKRLLQLDLIENDNKKILGCLRNIKYVPKTMKEAQKIEREKTQQRNEANKEKRDIKRQGRLDELPEILNERSSNTGV